MKNSSKILCYFTLFLIMSCTKKYNINHDFGTYTITSGSEKNHAEEILHEVLTTNKDHNIIQPSRIIVENPEMAIKVAELILFGIYEEKNIRKQRPYKISDYKDYYVIEGTMDRNSIGGTFLIIISKKNAEILKITHGE